MPLRKFVFVFGTAFALCYAIAVGRQLALFTVFPSLGIVLPGTVQSRDIADPALGFIAPAMYWYGGPRPRPSAPLLPAGSAWQFPRFGLDGSGRDCCG